MIVPHYFQTDAKLALFDYLNNGPKGNPLICMPTGTGKSIVLADIITEIFKYRPHSRVLMLTHVEKLITQNADKLYNLWPTVPLGIHSAGLDRRDTFFPVIYGGVQSVCPTLKKNPTAFGKIDLLFVDEAHLLGADENSQYLIIIKILTLLNPELRVIGLTATPYRLKMGLLTDGEIFSDICYNITTFEWFRKLIDEGYLCPLIGKPTTTKIYGLEKLSIVGGDYNQSEAEKIIDTDEITYSAVKEILEFGWNRNKCIVFAAGIKNAFHIASVMQSMGASAAAVHSKTPKGESKKLLEAYENGEIWALVGANKFTTGYDVQSIDLIADMQPTCSPGKHVQKLGRGTRVHATKEDTLVLDFVNNIWNNGPIDDPRLPRKPGAKTGEPPPIKICESFRLKKNEGLKPEMYPVKGCGAYNHASLRFCCNCKEEFSFQNKLSETAYAESPMKKDDNPILELIEIRSPIYYNKKEGKQKALGIGNPTVQVTYPFGMRSINVYLCFEHTGFPRHLAHEWWKKHSSNEPPKTVDEFLSRTHELRTPKAMFVHVNLKYPEIKSLEF